jgi:primosomal protein N''
MTAVYGVGKDYDGTLFSNTQSILRNLAELNRDLQNIINKHFRDSISKASRIATRLLLQYHHVSFKTHERNTVTHRLSVRRPHNKTPDNVCFTYAY